MIFFRRPEDVLKTSVSAGVNFITWNYEKRFSSNRESIRLKKRNKVQVKKYLHCSLWHQNCFFVALRIWRSIPRSHKEFSSVNEFKAKNKFWQSSSCPRKVCKNYIYQIGYTKYMLPVICWLFCYLRELVQRLESGTQSVWKCLWTGAHLLWKSVKWFAL